MIFVFSAEEKDFQSYLGGARRRIAEPGFRAHKFTTWAGGVSDESVAQAVPPPAPAPTLAQALGQRPSSSTVDKPRTRKGWCPERQAQYGAPAPFYVNNGKSSGDQHSHKNNKPVSLYDLVAHQQKQQAPVV